MDAWMDGWSGGVHRVCVCVSVRTFRMAATHTKASQVEKASTLSPADDSNYAPSPTGGRTAAIVHSTIGQFCLSHSRHEATASTASSSAALHLLVTICTARQLTRPPSPVGRSRDGVPAVHPSRVGSQQPGCVGAVPGRPAVQEPQRCHRRHRLVPVERHTRTQQRRRRRHTRGAANQHSQQRASEEGTREQKAAAARGRRRPGR